MAELISIAGRVPPNSPESEMIVLGTIMSERGAYDRVIDVLTPDCFYSSRRKKIFNAIKQIKEIGEFPDMIRVSHELGSEFMYEVAEITGYVSGEMYQHALIIRELNMRRKLIELTMTANEQAFSNSIDVDETINGLVDNLKEIYNETSSGIIHLSDAVEAMRENIKENMDSKERSSGSLTGFKDFDSKGGGLQSTDLIIVAGESSMGKTSLALSICNNIAENNNNIAIYSLEMSSIQLASRISAMRTGIPANELLYSKLTQEQFERIETNVSKICKLGIFIDERSTANIDSIIGSIRNMKAKYNISGAMIDYLQIVNINEKGVNEETKLGIAARRLKNLAKELDIWIVALSQLNRDSNPYPTLGRLRGSGQIGEAADIVLFAYRPEYYGQNKQYPDEFAEFTTRGTGLIDVAKGRNIGTFRFLTKFERPITHFTNIDNLEKYRIINCEIPVENNSPFPETENTPF